MFVEPSQESDVIIHNFEFIYPMRYLISFSLIIFLNFSCNRTEKFPAPETLPVYSVNFDHLQWKSSDSEALEGDNPAISAGLKSLFSFREFYFQKDERFDLKKFRELWDEFRKNTESIQLTEANALAWFHATGFLFELTGDPDVAEELERISALHLGEIRPGLRDSVISPYVITKNVDQIWVNLFLPAKIQYTHSMGGEVSMALKPDFDKNSRIRLEFGMEKKRFIEVLIRIPSWASNVSVEVKGVKYVAKPGSYCLIAKKWKEGDLIDVQFSTENFPGNYNEFLSGN